MIGTLRVKDAVDEAERRSMRRAACGMLDKSIFNRKRSLDGQ
jgi:hypothetical protein